MKNINIKSRFFALVVIILFSFSLSIIIFSPVSLTNFVSAFTGDYSKDNAANADLDYTDWNNLPSDFLDKQNPTGDTMSGPLNMGNNTISNLPDPSADDQAVNRGYMNNAISSSSMTTTSGSPLKVVCGKTIPGATGWIDDAGINKIYADIDTTAAGFLVDAVYFTAIGGLGYHLDTNGSAAIFNNTPTGFTTKIRYTGTFAPFDAAQAETWQWYISWCGYGN